MQTTSTHYIAEGGRNHNPKKAFLEEFTRFIKNWRKSRLLYELVCMVDMNGYMGPKGNLHNMFA